MKRNFLYAVLCCILAASTLPGATYAFAPEESRLEVYVPRAGLLSILGHDHTITAGQFEGSLEMEPGDPATAQITARVPAGSLTVVDEGVSDETRSKIETEMRGDQVLQQDVYPEIFFESMEVSTDASGEWEIQGALTVRGVTRPVSFSVEVTFLSGDRFEASGIVPIKPEVFGIKPVRALGGAVRTASTIEVRFRISGKKEVG